MDASSEDSNMEEQDRSVGSLKPRRLSLCGDEGLSLLLRIAKEICVGMAFLHSEENGIVHRDLKPANVLLTHTFQPKITDFGDSRKKATRMSINIGTPIYQAPEQFASDRSFYRENKKIEYDKSIDVYAFAIILWELWTGDVPYVFCVRSRISREAT